MAFYDGNLRTLKIAQADGLERVAQAVHRLTREPAEFIGVDAGRLEPGARADLVVIDPEALRRWDPEQTYRHVWRECFEHRQIVNRPEGVVRQVMIGGRLAWNEGQATERYGLERFGRVLLERTHEAREATLAAC
jgi:N-acyl-D-aspartate/D-glutamate deacylase